MSTNSVQIVDVVNMRDPAIREGFRTNVPLYEK